MTGTVNAVVNNLADRFGEMVEVISPISQTVVLETANSGFIYTMVGIGIAGLAVVCLTILVWAMNRVTDKILREYIVAGMIICAVIFTFVGFVLIMVNMNDWFAPTKQVVRELIEKLQ